MRGTELTPGMLVRWIKGVGLGSDSLNGAFFIIARYYPAEEPENASNARITMLCIENSNDREWGTIEDVRMYDEDTFEEIPCI